MKRIWIMFCVALMVLFCVPGTVHAAGDVTVTVKADKSVAYPSDTINYTVSIGPVDNLGGLDFWLKVPEGLTFTENSVVVPEGVFETLNAEKEDTVVPRPGWERWCHSTTKNAYTGTEELVLFTFSCTVNEDAKFEDKSMTLEYDASVITKNPLAFDHTTLEDMTVNYNPAVVKVEKAPVPVTGVTLDETTLTLKDGETKTLTAAVLPADADNQNVDWSSDNTAVASVDNGKITALKAGSAKITVTTKDGGKTAVCSVTVTCSHTLKKVEAVAATCGKDGNIAYYTCEKCGKKFSDEAGTKEVTETVVPATGNHTETEIRNQTDATEEKEGYTGDTYCKACGQKIQTGSTIPKLPHTHVMTKTDAVAATCEKDGSIAYYTCQKCGKKYADEAGTKEVTDVSVKAPGHKPDGTWKSDDSKHWQICTVCGEMVNSAEHSYEWKLDKAATEDETGLKHEECVCGRKRSEDTVIPKLDHVHTGIQHHAALAATCMQEGSKEYWTCSSPKCAGRYYADAGCQLEITDIVLPVNPDNHVYDNDADAICNACGYRRFYIVLEGANGVYEQDSPEGLAFKVDGELALFKSLEIDGAIVAAENYSLAEGSTLLTLKASYLDTLEIGEHQIRMLYSDGKAASTGFSVKEEDDDDADSANTENSAADKQADAMAKSPKTGDESSLRLWMGLLFAVLAGIAVTLGYKKKAGR